MKKSNDLKISRIQKTKIINKMKCNYEIEKDFKILKLLTLNKSADIGACDGHYTNLLLKISKKVFSFEPSPVYFKFLKEIFKKKKKVNLINYALSDKSKKNVSLYSHSSALRQASLIKKKKVNTIFKVNTLTGDIFFKKKSIDFIKIDVEGLEFNVLKGLKKTHKTRYPILLVEIEKRHTKNFKLIFNYLKNLKYEIFYLEKNFKLSHLTLNKAIFLVKNSYKKRFITKKWKRKTYVNNFWFVNKKSKNADQLKKFYA